MNVGIIGFGKMGKIRRRSIEAVGHVVKSLYDPDLEKTVKTNCFTSNYESMFEDPDLDVIFICTPNYMNKELVIKSLKAGKHVFCEKPPAFTSKDVEDIIEIEKDSPGKLMYGFNHRHHDSIITLKEMIDSGEYGKILWMRGRYGKSSSKDFFTDWRSDEKLSGGGILIDQGIHMLDLFLFLSGNFHEVQALISNSFWNLPGIEDNVFAILKNNKNGIVASLHSTMTQWRHLFSFEVFLERGYFTINGLKTSSGTYGEEILTIAKNRTASPMTTWKDETKINYSVDNSWDTEVGHFFKAVEDKIPVKMGNSQDALKLMKVVDKIYKFKGE